MCSHADLNVPVNGWVNTTGYFPGDTATYSCKPKYGLVGNEKRNCTILGYWNRAAPLCERMYNDILSPSIIHHS